VCCTDSPLKQQQAVHTGGKPHVRAECGYKCTYRSNLVRQSRIYTGRIFVHKKCVYMFTNRFNMIRQFGKKCDKFAHKSNHVSHSTTHTKAEAHSHTSTPGEFSKPNGPQSQNELYLTNEEWLHEPLLLPSYLCNSLRLSFYSSFHYIPNNGYRVFLRGKLWPCVKYLMLNLTFCGPCIVKYLHN